MMGGGVGVGRESFVLPLYFPVTVLAREPVCAGSGLWWPVKSPGFGCCGQRPVIGVPGGAPVRLVPEWPRFCHLGKMVAVG